MGERTDVVVVGAGFAGLAAARELHRLGLRAVVVEARERLGGRTWTAERLGCELELGGTWVHPFQPFVWAEIQRLGLPVVASPVPVRAHWRDADGLHAGTVEELWGPLEEPMRRFAADAATAFPAPFDPLAGGAALARLDALSVADRIEALGLPPALHERMRALWSLHFCAPCEEGALTQALRWLALGNGDWQLLGDVCETLRLDGGTRALAEAIAAEHPLDVRLGATVARVGHGDDGAVVRLAGVGAIACAAVIVTAGIGALGRIAFDPALPAPVAELVRRGQASRGVKVWARLAEPLPPFCALAAPPHPLTWLRSEHGGEPGTLAVGFGVERRLDPEDTAAVQAAVRTLLPEATVVASTGADWVADPLAGETWPMLRPGQLTGALVHVRALDGALRLAGSYAADGWAGFVDGALESGMRAARSVAARAVSP
jgi:monoamine oxidase